MSCNLLYLNILFHLEARLCCNKDFVFSAILLAVPYFLVADLSPYLHDKFYFRNIEKKLSMCEHVAKKFHLLFSITLKNSLIYFTYFNLKQLPFSLYLTLFLTFFMSIVPVCPAYPSLCSPRSRIVTLK